MPFTMQRRAWLDSKGWFAVLLYEGAGCVGKAFPFRESIIHTLARIVDCTESIDKQIHEIFDERGADPGERYDHQVQSKPSHDAQIKRPFARTEDLTTVDE